MLLLDALDAGGEGPAGPVKLVIRPERVHVAAGEATGPTCIPAMVTLPADALRALPA